MRQKRASRYRFYPTPEQAAMLALTFGCTRYVYNWALRLRTDAYNAYDERHERIGYLDASPALTTLNQQPESPGSTRYRACRCNRHCATSMEASATSLRSARNILASRRCAGGRRRPMRVLPSGG